MRFSLGFWRRSGLRFLLGGLSLLVVLAAQAQQRDLLVVFDASGSMWGQVEGENKIVTARRVLGEVTSGLPASTQLGLVAYGHRREADCNDIETLIAPSPGKAAALKSAVDAINPKGKTPITRSLEQAVDIAKASTRPTTIVLLSDGIETCGGDVCAMVQKAKAANIDFLLHIIGFDIGKEDAAPFECAAQAGGGFYFDAANSEQLVAAMEQAMEPEPVVGDAKLAIKAMRNGQPADAVVEVMPAAKSERVGYGRTYTGAATNPRVFDLPAGNYDIKVTVLGMKAPPVTFSAVALPSGQRVDKVADFSSGKIAVKVTKNGALHDATVNVTVHGTKTSVGGGRTYTAASSNPRIVETPPGEYDVTVQPLQASGVAAKTFESVVVKAGQTVELEHTLSTGELSVKVTRNGKLSDATVAVTAAGDGARVAGSRTYVSPNSNPRVFTVEPGLYDVEVKALEVKGWEPQRRQRIEVKPEQRAEVEIAYQSGTLTISTASAGQLIDATVNISAAGQGGAVDGGRTYAKPKAFELKPGKYTVVVKAVRPPGLKPQTIEVEITAQQAIERTVNLAP